MFGINGSDSIVLFVIFIMISVLVGNFSRKSVKKNRDAHLPGWYRTLRPILQGIMFLFIISYFFTQKTYLIIIGVVGLVMLDVIHTILTFIMGFLYKRIEGGAAINEQPAAPQQKPFDPNNPETASAIRDIGEILNYPTFSQPGTQNKNTLQPSNNIDHFSNRTGIFVVLLIFMAIIFAAAVAYLFFIS